jgi:hypothetical protein
MVRIFVGTEGLAEIRRALRASVVIGELGVHVAAHRLRPSGDSLRSGVATNGTYSG